MTPPIEVGFHPASIDDLTAAAAWYGAQSPSAVGALVEELERAIRLIAESPQRWPPYLGGTRRFLLRRFPLFVVYRIHADSVLVVAVAHARRRPGYWHERG